jgi:4-amino-4-deoxy-L-arabinose transferase-like glycosyltransferase
MRPRLADAAFTAAALLYCALLWWPTRGLPYHWDGATFTARAAQDLLARDFSPFVVHYSEFAHPPLFIATLALCWKWFGNGLAVAHLLELPFLPLLLLSTYALGTRLYGRSVGAAAAVLTATAPVVAAEYGQIYFDLPLAGLLTFGLLCWLSGWRIAAGLLFGASIGIKIPAIVFPCALLAIAAVRPASLRRAWPLGLAFVLLVTWLVYHHAIEGFWLRSPGRRGYTPHGAVELLDNAWRVSLLVLAQRRWAIAVLGLAAALGLLVRERRVPRPSQLARFDPGTLTLGLITMGGVVFFALAGEFAQRYGIMLMPPIFLLACAALHALLRTRAAAYWALVAVASGLHMNGWLPPQQPASHYEYRPDDDLHYLDMIALGLATADYMQREHPHAMVFGSWPEAYWLSATYFGYVQRPFAVANCEHYRADLPGEKVIFGGMYSPGERACWKLIRATSARPVKKLTVAAKWVQVHVVP